MMKILALETTEKFGSVALLEGKRLLREIFLPKTDRSAKTLAPAMEQLLRDENCSPGEIEAVAVVVGPGSFTGLRVGVATAKVFAYAVGAKVVAVNTLQTVAAGFRSDDAAVRFLSVGVDAQRGDVVVQEFELPSELSPEEPQPISERRLISVADWWLEKEKRPGIVFVGPALERFQTKIPEGTLVAEESFWMPKASVVGRLAADRLAVGQSDHLESLLPIYSRLSAAEERQNAK